MQRVAIAPRPDWIAKVEALGFDWHSAPTPEDPIGAYWDESAYWHLSADEVDLLEAATADLHTMCLAAADHAIKRNLLPYFGFPPSAIGLIEQSWASRSGAAGDTGQPTLYGRFDLAFAGAGVGDGQPKMLEYNADTPTGLFEAAVVQWTWLEERFPDHDQFNSLHEGLVAAWAKIGAALSPNAGAANFSNGAVAPVHFSCLMPHAEDEGTLRYLLDTALEAGLSGKTINAADIGWAGTDGGFVDLEDTPITALFKLLPWDWMLSDRFGPDLTSEVGAGRLTVIEPAWKMVLANKAILAVLWELYPGHPNLLPAFMDRRAFAPGDHVVAKPLLGREGANISIAVLGADGAPAAAPLESMGGAYGAEGYVYQALTRVAESAGVDHTGRAVTHRAVIGSWMIDGSPRGIGIREDTGLITHNRSRFVPHLF